jgi:hypothetical protein
MSEFWPLIFTAVALCSSLLGLWKSMHKQAFSETPQLAVFGIFVWGDAIIFGLFWALAGVLVFLTKSEALMWLIYSVFWVVRSFGESIYWFNQQFSTINRNPPERLRGFRFYKNDSVWFAYQIWWQCVTVVAILASIYFGYVWLTTLR